MKTYLFILFLYALLIASLLPSCHGNYADETIKTESSASDTIITYNDKVDEQLKLTDTAIMTIEQKITERGVLIAENKALKIELKATKDTLIAIKKMIKKRTLIQKILGINKDTITNQDTTKHVQ